MVNDPIADLIVRIKNASAIGTKEIELPYSIMKHSVSSVLKTAGFIEDVQKKGKKEQKILALTLPARLRNSKPLQATRISKPSKRVYIKASEIKPVRNGRGVVILSTPKGILSGSDARKENVGGELLCKVW